MESVSGQRAQAALLRLLDEPVAGRSFVLTEDGQLIARLVPVRASSAQAGDVIAALRHARREVTVGTGSLADLVDDGRR